MNSKATFYRNGKEYLSRYYIIPENDYFNVYLHQFLSSDYEGVLHDHPWSSLSILLSGEYYETIHNGTRYLRNNFIFPPLFRNAQHSHQIELISKTAWTLFFTGPVIREWGFLCPQGFVPYKQYLDNSQTHSGKGCDIKLK